MKYLFLLPIFLYYSGFQKLSIKEPSSASFFDNKLFILGDSGDLFIYKKDSLIASKSYDFEDSEGIYVDDKYIYITEERSRKIVLIDQLTLEIFSEFHVPFNGRLNRGFEGISFNKQKNLFVIVTEENPCQIIELNNDFSVFKYIDTPFRELSDITWYDNHLWVLSDQESKVFKLDPINYKIIDSWDLKILNPEGITFSKEKMIIVSDNLNRLYYYDLPL